MIKSANETDLSSERLAFVSACVERNTTPTTHSNVKPPRHWLRMDIQRIQAGEYDLAISSLTEVVQKTQSPVAYLLLTEAYMRNGQIDMALITLDILSYVEPAFIEAVLMRGLIQIENGEDTEARASLQTVVASRPSLLLAWKVLIDMALERGDFHEAAKLLSEAIRHHPAIGNLTGLPAFRRSKFVNGATRSRDIAQISLSSKGA